MPELTNRSYLPILLPLLLCLTACQGPAPAEPSPPVDMLLGEAEFKIYRQDRDGALETLDQATHLYPASSDVYELRGSLLESQGRYPLARQNWARARQTLSPSTPGHTLATYRLLLLLAFKLERPEAAADLLEELPEGSVYRKDANGVLLLKGRKIRDALIAFNQALQMTRDKDLLAGILLHAAYAYHRLGDDKQTSKALYGAINLTRDPSLVKEIETLWRQTEDPAP